MFNSKLVGYFKIEATKPNGEVRVLADWFPNLILNQGLDRIGVGVDWMDCCQVGSSNTPALTTQTQLVSWVAGSSTIVSNDTASSGASPWYTWYTRVFSFAAGVAEGNLKEVGVGWATTGTTLFSRALILDAYDFPTTVVVCDDDIVTVTYLFRRYLCEVDTTGTFAMGGVTYSYTGRAANIGDIDYWPAIFSYDAGTPSCATYNDGLGVITAEPAEASGTPTTSETVSAYVPGSYTAEWRYDFALAEGNATTGVRSVLVVLCGGVYQVEFTPVLPKTASITMYLVFQASWYTLVNTAFRGVYSDNGVFFNGVNLIGDRTNGKIYSLNPDTYTDDGEDITRIRRTQIVNKERVNVIHHRVEVEFEPGVGLDVADTADGHDPQASLRWSDDDGNTWSTSVTTDIGEYQKYGVRALWRRLGKSRNRVYELTINSPVKCVIIGAYVDLEACKF